MILPSRVREWFKPAQRSRTEKLWLVACIIYDIARAIVVSHFFGKHGVNGWHYFAYEMLFSVLFAKASFHLILAFLEHKVKDVFVFSLFTMITFFAPDVYVYIKGDGVPVTTWVLFFGYLCCTSTISVIALVRDYHRKRRARDGEHASSNRESSGRIKHPAQATQTAHQIAKAPKNS